MGFVPYAVASALEVGLLSHLGLMAQRSALQSFLLLAVAQICAVKAFNVLIWPFWLSPLRELPGPKVTLPPSIHLTECQC